ncbi:MAG: tRNA 2-thiouridine(34) synthase MnmA [Opitutaceae bacterium]|nr:tRNA 2-thiouridine(34) synthase MnmA [Opitutaceae bacterium]
MPARERILVAMSGGVDSSVAALLLQRQGCDLVGAYMKNWINEDNVIGHCPWMQDIEDARAVCDRLGIEFRIVNLMREYRERIVQYLLDGYARGLTPNPDIMCNREIKFGVFRAWAKDNGFAAVATGHYARRVEAGDNCGLRIADRGFAETGNRIADTGDTRDTGNRTPETGFELIFETKFLPGIRNPKSEIRNWQLWEGADKNKDQSYFLALLNQEQLRDARFPIGDLTKPQLRALAREAGLPTAAKKDSQGICFIGEVKMADFLRAYVPDAPGPIVRAMDGRELGTHRGLHFYTLGQRKGIGVPSNTDNEAYVVVGKRAADRALLVAFDHPDAPGLFQTEVRVHSVSWIGEPVTTDRELEGRVRYRDPRVPLRFVPEEGDTARINFQTPQRGLASGQVLAFYEGERLLGGGIYL